MNKAREDKNYRFFAPNESFSEEVIKKLRKDGIIFHRNGVVGAKITKREGYNPLMTLLIEDDGGLYGQDFQIDTDWIDNMIEVLQDAKKYVAYIEKKRK